jgi:hypothetical protein
MSQSCIGWDIHLKDGRVFSWSEADGCGSEREARAQLASATGTDAEIDHIEQIEVVYQQRIDQ